MMKGLLYSLLLASCICPTTAMAQQQEILYRTDAPYLAGIKLFENGTEKVNAWAGGHNNPQFASVDIDRNGLLDLVVIEPRGGVNTYLNKGTAGSPKHIYTPELEFRFPKFAEHILTTDFNCDAIPDLIYGDPYIGVVAALGYYDSGNLLMFKDYKPISYSIKGNTSLFQLAMVRDDMGAFIDFDKDGDIDVLFYDKNGAGIQVLQNLQVENGLPCGEWSLRFRNRCWGMMSQGVQRTHVLNRGCINTDLIPIMPERPDNPYRNARVNKTTDGSNTLCLFDAEGDGDYDALNGNVLYSDIQFLKNGKVEYSNNVAGDTIISQDTTWNSANTPVFMPGRPAAFWLDVDHDGDKDILISPHRPGSENYKCIAWYENIGTPSSSFYVYRTDTYLIESMMDLGGKTYPVVYDYNKDGLLDLIVGTAGKYNAATGSTISRIVYYKNTGTTTAPVFTLEDDNFLNISSLGFRGGGIAIGDLNNDGKDDLLLSKDDGTFAMFANNAVSNAVAPNWQLLYSDLADESGLAIQLNAGGGTPCLYDIDKSAQHPNTKDLIIGRPDGTLILFRNIGGTAQVKLKFETLTLGNVDVGSDAAPFFGKIDNTGIEYLLVGSSKGGTIKKYDGFQNGNITTPYVLKDDAYSDIHGNGQNIVPMVADVNGDGKYDMFLGNDLGGVELFRQVWNASVEDVRQESPLHIYPNPANNAITIALAEVQMRNTTISLYNSMGQLITNVRPYYSGRNANIDISKLTPGVYMCVVSNEGKRHSAIFSKQ